MKVQKQQIFFIILIFNSILLMSNSISGIIQNEKKQPIEFANITVFKTNDSIHAATTLSDSLGAFTFSNLAENNYSIEVSYLGYITDTIKNILIKDRVDIINIENRIDTIIVQDNAIQLNEIQLKLSSTTLNEVQVTATKPIYERKADRIIFNVENSVYSQGSDAMQALSKAPRVQVNNNEIKIAGRGDAAVLINDRLVRMSGEELSHYLKSIPSNDIQKIEVIPNPPAKYDAQGAALINIVLKKNKKQGYNGSVFASYKQATFANGNGGININYNKKKISLKTSLGTGRNIFFNEQLNTIEYTTQNWESERKSKNKNYSFYGTFGLDYEINKKSSIGINYLGYYLNSDNYKENNLTNILSLDKQLQSYILNNSTNSNTSNQQTINTYYTLKIDSTGKKLDIGFDFFNGSTNKNRNYTTATYNNKDSLLVSPIPKENTNGKYKSFVYSFNASMQHPVKYGDWQYGIKLTSLNITSNNLQTVLQNDIYTNDTNRSNLFNYKEIITAGFTSLSKTIKKVEIEIGLRIEYTHTLGSLANTNTSTKRNYIRPFPSLFIQYKKDEKNSFNFSLNSRIERPHFSTLNPFRFYTSDYSYTTGNPFLLPSYIYSASIDYNFKKNYTLSLYYNYSGSENTQVTFIDEATKISYQNWVNSSLTHDLGFYNEFTYDIKDWWTITSSIDASIDFIKSPYLYNANRRIYWNMQFDVSNDFILDKQNRFIANIYYLFRPPNRGYLEAKSNMYNQLDASIRMILLKKKQLSISLNAHNMLKSKYNGFGISPTGQKTTYNNYFDDRNFTISLSYKFGNDKLKTKYRKTENLDITRAK